MGECRTKKIGFLGAVIVTGCVFADSLGNVGDVRLKGYLGERLDAMILNHVAAQERRS